MYIVITGGGKVGEYLASILLESGNDVAVIEQNRQAADRLSMMLSGRYLIINGDGCDSKYQEDAGIHKADVFVAATGKDDNNLVSCEIAQRVFKVPRCIARVNAPKNQRIFRALGIECISSTELIANLIEEETLMGSVGTVSSLMHSNVALLQFSVPYLHDYDGEDLLVDDLDLPEGSLVVAVDGTDGMQVAKPGMILKSGDSLIVAADSEVAEEVRDYFRLL